MSRRAMLMAAHLALLGGVPVVLASSMAAIKKPPEAQYKRALDLMRRGEHREAVKLLKSAVAESPRNAYYLKALGLCHLQLKEFDDAIVALRGALAADPSYVDARMDLAVAYMLKGDRDKGKAELISVFEDSTYVTPEIAAANLGSAYLEEGNLVSARQWFEKALARKPDYLFARDGLKEVEARLPATPRPSLTPSPPAASPIPRPAAPMDPELVKGIQQLEEGNLDEAIDNLTALLPRLSRDPARASDLAQAYLHLGVAHVAAKQEEAALGYFREALKLDPGIQLDPARYPRRTIRTFEAARKRAEDPSN